VPNKNLSSSFGELLRGHRLAAGLTQQALAERAGVSVEAVSTLERGLGSDHAVKPSNCSSPRSGSPTQRGRR
jgi:DNA-binding XRE family transcriptional regulator